MERQPERGATLGRRVLSLMGADALRSSAEIHRENARLRAAMGGDSGEWAADPEEEEAENEHRSLDAVPLGVSVGEMVGLVGSGVAWYFRFLRYIWRVNAALLALSLLNVVPHLAEWADRPRDQRAGFPSMLYLSSYSSNMRWPWTVSSAVASVAFFAVGPWYRHRVVGRTRRLRAAADAGAAAAAAGTGDAEAAAPPLRLATSEAAFVEDAFEGQYRTDTDECVDRIPYDSPPTYGERAARMTASGVVFVLVVVLQGLVNYYLQQLLRERQGSSDTSSSGANSSVVLALVIMAANAGFRYFCKRLTVFERHLYYSDFRRADVIKLGAFKICNVLTLFFVKRYEVLENTSTLCPLFLLADQAFWLLVLDVTVVNAVEIVLPALTSRYTRRQAEMSEHGNDHYRPEFDLAEEYVEIVSYRFLIVGLGTLVMPSLSFFGLVANVLEYYLDKYRLLRLSAKPRRTNNTYASVLMFFFFAVGVAIMLSFPNGAVWMLTGAGGLSDASRGCAIFE